MKLWIGLRYLNKDEFMQSADVRSCLEDWQKRGHTLEWLCDSSQLPEFRKPEKIDGRDGQHEIQLLLTDDETLAQQGNISGYTVFGFGSSCQFSGATLVFENGTAMSVGFMEMMGCHANDIPYEIGSKDGVTLRESTSEDFSALYDIFAEEGIPMFELSPEDTECPAADRDRNSLLPKMREQMQVAYEQYIQVQYRFYGFGIWTVLNDTGEVIGWCGFGTARGETAPDMGYIIRRSSRGKHAAYHACKVALGFIRDELQLSEVVLHVRRTNLISIHIAEKLGFIPLSCSDGGEVTYHLNLA